MRKIPLKNYFIIAVILLLSVIGVFYLVNWYNTTQKHYKETSIIADLIKEVKISEFDNYITENPDFIIYLADKTENINIKFEKNLKKLITKKDLQKQFVFMNVSEFDEENIKEFIQKYADKAIDLKMQNSIIIIDNQKIKNLLIIEANDKDSKKVETFLKENEVL